MYFVLFPLSDYQTLSDEICKPQSVAVGGDCELEFGMLSTVVRQGTTGQELYPRPDRAILDDSQSGLDERTFVPTLPLTLTKGVSPGVVYCLLWHFNVGSNS